MKCRFIDTGFNDAFTNMAIDEALLNSNVPVLRVYGWKPAVSLGYNQNLDGINLDYCKENNIGIVRRLTGGKAVFHDLELTYSFIVPEDANLLPFEVNESYRVVAKALITALDKIGIEGKLIGVDITDKMLDQARKRINENSWKNVELIESDFAEYQFPQELDGIFTTGALQYSTQYDKIIKQGHDALKPTKKFVIMDFKMSQGPAKIFAPLIVFFTKPFGANEEYLKGTAWKSIEKYFEKTSYLEGWGGFLYISVGTKN